ncbi:glycosyltransferase [Allorhizobium terrae]|uniref:Glycosyltransferase n=1 Tax=Allorhizobium terrae TaxID=1848972 RepID=A0A4S3ZR54_9HYPH|nr:glycosyltransferase [Allorhizobium terrae]THF48080.1 glycosyltransferase [Allorhizobium terrae]
MTIDKLNIEQSSNIEKFPYFYLLKNLVNTDKELYAPVDAISEAYCIYRAVSHKQYDCLHFHDRGGAGFYCTMARRQGLMSATIVTHLNGSSLSVRKDTNYPPDISQLECEAIERTQIELSDEVVVTNVTLLSHYQTLGIRLPTLNLHVPLLGGDSEAELVKASFVTRSILGRDINELVFIGSHDLQEGLPFFIDAITRLSNNINPDITIIGEFSRWRFEFTGAFVLRRLSDYRGHIRFLNVDTPDQLASLLTSKPNALCFVPPSLASPFFSIAHCFKLGLPFLTTDGAEAARLVAPQDHSICFSGPTPINLARAIERCLNEGVPQIRSNISPSETIAQWYGWIANLRKKEIHHEQSADMPLVSVCVTHHERPALLRQAIDALMKQTYDNIEIIIVDDGSRNVDAIALLKMLENQPTRFPVTVVWSDNRYLGAARNTAAAHAKGDYILFHDDDNLSVPTEVEVFLNAAIHSGFDILTCMAWIDHADDHYRGIEHTNKIEYYPVGVGGVFSFLENRFGDANAFFKRSTFQALGGFSALYGIGLEDWELFLKAFLRGFSIGVVPEPLYTYRVSRQGMLSTSSILQNYERIFRMVDAEAPPLNADVLRLAYRNTMLEEAERQTKRFLERLPGGDIHLKLMSSDPLSDSAREDFCDLAYILGRTAESVELSAFKPYKQADFVRRVQLEGASRVAIRSCGQILEPFYGPPDKLFALIGWAFRGKGRPVTFSRITINGRSHRPIFNLRVIRPDVRDHFQIRHDCSLGFLTLVTTEMSTKSSLQNFFMRDLRIGNIDGLSIGLVTRNKKIQGNVDTYVPCIEATVELREIEGRISYISIESPEPRFIFHKSEGEDLRQPDRVTSSNAIFKIQSQEQKLTFIVPDSSNVRFLLF